MLTITPPQSSETATLISQGTQTSWKKRLPKLTAVGCLSTLLILPMSGCVLSSVIETTDETVTEEASTDTGETSTDTTNTDTGTTGTTEVNSTENTVAEEVTAYDPSDVAVLTETNIDGWNIALLDDATTATLDGETIFSITFKITNNSGEAGSVSAGYSSVRAGSIYDIEVFQNGIQCDARSFLASLYSSWDLYDRLLLEDESNNLTIQDGVTLYIPVFYTLNDDTGEVSFEIIDSDYTGDTTLLSITYTPGA